MTRRPIAYVMEQTLGNVTHYLNLREAEELHGSPPPIWLPIEYTQGRLPWTLSGGYLARKALKPVLDEVDGVFVHTITLALGLTDLFGSKPFVLSCDATPYAKRYMRLEYGQAPQFAISEVAKRELYRQMLKRASGYVAWSNWAKQSLVRDYGCSPQDVAVISPGVDVTAFSPAPRVQQRPRILFVGGDFVRKGGDLVVNAYRKHLRAVADLVLVTQERLPEEPGITVYNHLSANSPKLRELYATSDVFVMPTRADCYALVCMEALAAGMPVITTRVGGIPDMVREGITGHVIDVDDERALSQRLTALCSDPELRASMSRAARASALERFDATVNARRLFEFVRSRC